MLLSSAAQQTHIERPPERSPQQARSNPCTPNFVPVIAVFALCLLLVVGFVPMQQNADGLLLSIMSLQKPTIYYWAADRYGILTALLAVWIRDPVQNMYFQVGLEILAGLTAPIFFCALLLRRSAEVWRAALLTDCLFLLVANFTVIKQLFIQASPYGTSLACAGLASLVLRSAQSPLKPALATLTAAALIVTAYTVNFGLVTIALPLIVLFALLRPAFNSWLLVALHGLAAIIGRILPGILAPHFHTNLGLFFTPPDVIRYAGVVWRFTGWWFALAVTIPAVAFFITLALAGRPRVAFRWAILFAAVVAIALLNFGVIASSHWLVMNKFPIRYFVPTYLSLLSLGGMSLWLAAKLVFRREAAAFAGLAALLLLGALARFHAAPADNRQIVAANTRVLASAVASRVVALSVDGVAGAGHSDGYWYVWPAVFLAEEDRFRSGNRGPDVLGVTDRGIVRRDAFTARLAAAGRFRLVCVDLAPAACAADAGRLMTTPGLEFRSFAPAETITGGHLLAYVELTVAPRHD